MNRRDLLKALPSLAALPVVPEVMRASVGPKDVIVLKSGSHISMEAAEHLREEMRRVWPDNECVVMSGGLSLEIVRQG